MAQLTGKFGADFEPFYAAVQKADVSLKNFESGAGRVGSTLDKMVNSFSGKKVIEDAAMMEKAFQELAKNGVGLTTAELERMGRTAQEAAEKMKAMGVTVPPGIQKIADAAKAANKETTDWQGMLGGMAGTIGVTFGASAVIGFAKSVVDAGSKINDMSERLGISTDAVQGFQYAAEQSGSTLDAVGNALGKMNEKLAGGDKATVSALAALHLKFNDIRSMKPEDAFLAITDALQNVADPMERTRLGTELMGKGFKEILPAVTEGFRATAAGATKMSADAVKACDELGDAWSTLSTNVKAKSAEIILAGLDIVKNLSKWDNVKLAMAQVFTGSGASALAFAGAMEAGARASTNVKDVVLTLPGPVHKTKEELDAAAAAAKKYADEMKALADQFSGATATAKLKQLDITFRNLTASGRLTKEGMAALSKEAMQLANEGGTLTPTLLNLVLATGDLAPKLDKGALSVENLGSKVELTIPKLEGFNAAVVDLAAKTKEGFGGLDNLGFKAADGFKEGAKSIEESAKRDADAIKSIGNAFGQLANIAGGGKLGSLFGSLQGLTSNLALAKDANEKFGGSAGIASGMFSAQASTTEKWASATQSGAAVVGGAMEVWTATTNAGSKAAGTFQGAVAGAKAGAAFGPYGAAIGAAAGAIVGFVRAATAGRKAVEDFAGSMGGFDALHVQLNRLGAEGEKLWVNLTQGVNKSNPAEAKKAIDAITEALKHIPPTMAEQVATAGYQTADALKKTAADAVKLWEYMRDSGTFTAKDVADAWQKAQDAIAASGDEQMTQSTAALDAAKKNLSDLDAQIKSLQDSINSEAPEEVMGVVEAQSRAQLSALQQQREIAAKNLEDLQQSNTDALAALTTAITNIPTDIAIKVNLDYGGGAAPTAQHFAGGGFVSTPRTAVVGDSAEYITPRTSISMLASEIVRAGNVASGGGMATYVQPSATAAHVEQQIVVKVGDAVIARAAVSGMPRQFTLQGV